MKEDNKTKLLSVPIHSLLAIPANERRAFYDKVFILPAPVRRMLFDLKTGYFVQGLGKNYNIKEDKIWAVSFIVLRVATGEIKLAELPVVLSSELGIANDKAQQMANEIEKDLFGFTKEELDGFWARQKKDEPAKKAVDKATKGGAKNVLNLKEKKVIPPPPPMPGHNNN